MKNFLKLGLLTSLLAVFFLLAPEAQAVVTVTPATGGSAISADTVGGAYTTLTGPVVSEGSNKDIGVGTIILINAPAGFDFRTTANSVTATVSDISGCNASKRMLLGTSPGATTQTVTPTATTITINIFRASSGGCKNRITWSGIAVRPTAGTPLASGNITKSGTSAMVGVTSLTNFGTLTEVAGAINSVTVSPTGAQSVSSGGTIQFSAQGYDTYGNPISGLTYTWAVVPGTGTGTISSSGLFTAGNPGTVTVTATNGGKTGSSGTINVLPVATRFVILDPADGNIDNPVTITVQAQDSSGLVDTSYQNDVTLNASGSATGEGLVNITNGVGTIEISDNTIETVTLTLTDSQSTGLDISSTQTISFIAGATKKLSMTGDSSMTAGERVQLTITRRDRLDNLVSVGSEYFNLASDATGANRFYDAASGGNIVTTILIPNGNSSASVWYYDEKAGSANVTVSSIDETVSSGSLAITVNPASVASFHLNDPGDLVAGQRLAYNVTRKDQFGNLVTASSTTVYLYDDSSATSAVFYDAASGGNVVTSIVIPEGSSAKNFWFYADRAGSVTVTASDNSSSPDGSTGVNDASDFITVSAGPTAKYLLNDPGNMSVGNRIAYVVSRTDAYDTPTTEGDSTVYLYNNSTGTSTLFYDAASGGNTITSIVIPAGNNSIGFWFGSNDSGTFDVKASDNSTAPDGATGIADSQDTITVDPLPIVATRFVIVDPTDAVVGDTVPVTVKAVDGAGNIDATYQNDVTLKTSGNATPGGVVDIVNGIGEINITDTKAETVNLTLEDTLGTSLDVSSTQSVVFAPGPVAKFTLSDPGNAIAGTRSAYTVTRFDQYDNQVTSGITTFYLYSNATAGSYAFYDSASEGGQITSASILNNSATANVWFSGTKVGAWMVSASDNATTPDGSEGVIDGTDNIEITAGPTARLTLNDPGDMMAGTKLGYTATRYDSYNNLVTNGSATYYPYSNANGSTTAFYSSAVGTTPITSVSFSEGQSTADFWYGESKLGLWTVSLSDNSSSPDGATGIVDGEDAVTVSMVPIVATKFMIVKPANVYVGTPVEVTVRAVNDDGDIDTTYQNDVTLLASGSATGAGLVNIVNGVGQITINDTKEETVTLSLDDTQSTGLDTSSSETVTFSITAPLPSGGGGGGGAVTPRISFSGRAFPGAKLTILAIQDGQVPITKQVTGSTNGTFQINFRDDLPDGVNTFAVKAVDKNQQTAQTKIYKLGPYEQLSQRILISPTVGLKRPIVTQGTSLGVIGSAMPRYKVEAYVDGKSIGSATAGSNGQYEVLPNTYQLGLGDHTVKVKQIDTTGQSSDFSVEKSFKVVNTFIPRADLNGDGVVNVQDWSIFMSKWKSTDTKGREILDMNGDGKVDTQDFGTFMKAFNK